MKKTLLAMLTIPALLSTNANATGMTVVDKFETNNKFLETRVVVSKFSNKERISLNFAPSNIPVSRTFIYVDCYSDGEKKVTFYMDNDGYRNLHFFKEDTPIKYTVDGKEHSGELIFSSEGYNGLVHYDLKDVDKFVKDIYNGKMMDIKFNIGKEKESTLTFSIRSINEHLDFLSKECNWKM